MLTPYRALAVVSLSAVAVAGSLVSADDPPPFVITACVQGGLLSGAAPAPGDTSARAFAPRYRLAGKKALVKQIKKEHADHIDEFTGTTTGDGFGAPGTSMKMGKLSVRMGTTPSSPNAPYVPETPVFEVQSFRHLEGKCR
jgi:hypothetical protein